MLYCTVTLRELASETSFNPLEAYGEEIQHSDLIKNIFVFSEDERKSYGVGTT